MDILIFQQNEQQWHLQQINQRLQQLQGQAAGNAGQQEQQVGAGFGMAVACQR